MTHRTPILTALLACALAGLLAGPAAAAKKPKKTPAPRTFRVTVAGTSVYKDVATDLEDPDTCFDERGVQTGETVAKFRSSKPALMRAIPNRYGPGYRLVTVGGGLDGDLPLTVTYAHSGSSTKEIESCVLDRGNRWFRPPPPEIECPPKTVDDMGAGVSVAGKGRITLSIGEPLIPTPGGIFAGMKCPYGDLSGEIIESEGYLPGPYLFTSSTAAVALKGKDEWDYTDDKGEGSKGSKVVTATLRLTRVK